MSIIWNPEITNGTKVRRIKSDGITIKVGQQAVVIHRIHNLIYLDIDAKHGNSHDPRNYEIV